MLKIHSHLKIKTAENNFLKHFFFKTAKTNFIADYVQISDLMFLDNTIDNFVKLDPSMYMHRK